MIWLLLGNTYMLGTMYGVANYYHVQKVLNKFFTMVIISSDFAISMFYTVSAFINMYGLIKKF